MSGSDEESRFLSLGIERQILRTPLIASNVVMNANGSAQSNLRVTSSGCGTYRCSGIVYSGHDSTPRSTPSGPTKWSWPFGIVSAGTLTRKFLQHANTTNATAKQINSVDNLNRNMPVF